MDTKNGGPAFPVITASTVDKESGVFGHQSGNATWQFSGMTIRDYFAAHAPHKPAYWFVPKNVEPPLKWSEERIKLPHHCSATIHHCEKCDEYFAEQAALDKRNDELKSAYLLAQNVQWPWAYADAMIAARETK